MTRFLMAFTLPVLAVGHSSRAEAQAQGAAEDEAMCRAYGVEPTVTYEKVWTLALVRHHWPQYDSVPDLKLADAIYRKFHSEMPRAAFDSVFWRNSIKP